MRARFSNGSQARTQKDTEVDHNEGKSSEYPMKRQVSTWGWGGRTRQLDRLRIR
jgi:hypothetical protein